MSIAAAETSRDVFLNHGAGLDVVSEAPLGVVIFKGIRQMKVLQSNPAMTQQTILSPERMRHEHQTTLLMNLGHHLSSRHSTQIALQKKSNEMTAIVQSSFFTNQNLRGRILPTKPSLKLKGTLSGVVIRDGDDIQFLQGSNFQQSVRSDHAVTRSHRVAV